MAYRYEDYEAAADFLRKRLKGFEPEILLVLGSGLGGMADTLEEPISVGYEEIPNWKESTLEPGKKGRIVFGGLCGRRIAAMQVRLHCYEGNTMEEAAFPVRVMKLLGVKSMLITNSAGCVNTNWHVGELMLITDHIRLFGFGPLNGPNIDEFGPRFNDMTGAYDSEYMRIARDVAARQGIVLREGVYMYFPGPSFETPAEVRAARILGGDAVGMSTVAEVTVAAHCGIRTLGITVLSNMAAGITGDRLSDEEVHVEALKVRESFTGLITGCIRKM